MGIFIYGNICTISHFLQWLHAKILAKIVGRRKCKKWRIYDILNYGTFIIFYRHSAFYWVNHMIFLRFPNLRAVFYDKM